MPSIDFIKSEYPLHWLVWNNEYKELDQELSKKATSVSVKYISERTYSKTSHCACIYGYKENHFIEVKLVCWKTYDCNVMVTFAYIVILNRSIF
jgi:hypothetical protein